jgi:hypothetical protein
MNSSFIHHTLIMLEDIGMSIRYPDIRHVTINKDGGINHYISACLMTGTRVSIEQNQQMKFMMMFTLLDFYIDSNYPDFEGKTFAQKYKDLPSENDFDLMLRELFRIAKVIRNSLVHNPSSFKIFDGKLDISYQFRGTDFVVKMSLDALSSFYTSLVMYTKGDLGKGDYFLGVMRSIYKRILDGVSCFSDEFSSELNTPPIGLKIKPYAREIIMNPEYVFKDSQIQIKIAERTAPEWQGSDFYIKHNGYEVLVPMEALGSDLMISETELLNKWKYESSFPPIRKNL